MNIFGILLATVLTCAVLLSVPDSAAAAPPPICFNCTHLTDPDSCKNFNPCNAGEMCFHEVLETTAGDALYSWGCASSQLCQLEQGLSGRKKRLNIQRCFECCSDNFCSYGACQKDYCAKVTCQNGASCRNTALSHVCDCPQGYTGDTCQIDIDECTSQPCQNAAVCTDLIGAYRCTCQPGYAGVNCEIDIDECSSNPCKNGGTCIDGVAQYSCSCVPGFTGSDCETDIDECSNSPCQYNGTCIDLVNDYRCDCITGVTGKDCETNIDDCASANCQNGATCIDYIGYFKCMCVYGFAGTQCETSLGRVCYSCDGLSSASDCQNKTICAQDEQCFVEHELSSPGILTFSLGCVPAPMCAYLQSSGAAGRRGTNAIQLCYECCDVNNCNHQACVDHIG